MSGHTPGPWFDHRLNTRAHGVAHIGPRGTDITREVALVFGCDGFCGAEQTANARLIAAAPDMLDLLQELIDIEGPQPGHVEWFRRVQAMIAKATQTIPEPMP